MKVMIPKIREMLLMIHWLEPGAERNKVELWH